MKTTKSQIIIAYEDYETLNAYVKGLRSFKAFDKKNAALLQEELKKATLVKRDELPEDVVRLDSRVVIKEGSRNKLMVELVKIEPNLLNKTFVLKKQ
ncbi:MAG: hypothetical protein WKG06_04275 [Segetibacter sp.]